MENEKLILKVVSYIKDNYYDFAITDLLKEQGVAESDFKTIIDAAKEIVFEENVKVLTKRHKFLFAAFSTLAFLTLLYFCFILPYTIESVSTFFPILGTVLICLFSFLSLAYYKTWEVAFIRKHERPDINYSFLVILLIPGVILYFILSSRFETVADELLKENQVEVTGKIISGGETEIQNRRGQVTISTVVVEFKTTEGKKIIAYEDISHSEFQHFYLNQEVPLIYSKTNPQNIGFLMSDSNVSKFKNSAEKEIQPSDLIRLMGVGTEDIQNELNAISYGWEYNNQEMVWLNNRKNVAVAVQKNSVSYIAQNSNTAGYFLEKEGFKRSGKTKPDISSLYGNQEYQTKDFTATIKIIGSQNGEQPMAMTTITKK